MRKSKFLMVIIVFSLFLSSLQLTPHSAKAEGLEVDQLVEDNMRITQLENSPTYSEIMVENLETGEVSYIEITPSKEVGGEFVYNVMDGEMNTTNVVEFIDEELYLNGESISEDLSTGKMKNVVNHDGIRPMSTTTSVTWVYIGNSFGNSAWKVNDYGLVLGIILAIAKVNTATAILAAVATWAVNFNHKQVWYKRNAYYQKGNSCNYGYSTYFYSVSNYTGLIRYQPILSKNMCYLGY